MDINKEYSLQATIGTMLMLRLVSLIRTCDESCMTLIVLARCRYNSCLRPF